MNKMGTVSLFAPTGGLQEIGVGLAGVEATVRAAALVDPLASRRAIIQTTVVASSTTTTTTTAKATTAIQTKTTMRSTAALSTAATRPTHGKTGAQADASHRKICGCRAMNAQS